MVQQYIVNLLPWQPWRWLHIFACTFLLQHKTLVGSTNSLNRMKFLIFGTIIIIFCGMLRVIDGCLIKMHFLSFDYIDKQKGSPSINKYCQQCLHSFKTKKKVSHSTFASRLLVCLIKNKLETIYTFLRFLNSDNTSLKRMQKFVLIIWDSKLLSYIMLNIWRSHRYKNLILFDSFFSPPSILPIA
jgi:hypothetical protein